MAASGKVAYPLCGGISEARGRYVVDAGCMTRRRAKRLSSWDVLDGKMRKKYAIDTQSQRNDYRNSTRKSQRVVNLVTGIK